MYVGCCIKALGATPPNPCKINGWGKSKPTFTPSVDSAITYKKGLQLSAFYFCNKHLYIPKYNIAIEIDEEEHKYKRDYDKIRQKYIEKQIYCKFIRINEGESCGSAIARITKELYMSA